MKTETFRRKIRAVVAKELSDVVGTGNINNLTDDLVNFVQVNKREITRLEYDALLAKY